MERQQTDRMPRRLVHYDAVRRRLWIAGQRCHHGALGALCSSASVTLGLAPAARLALGASGAVLMVHDWADRALWFRPGWQSQP